MKEENVDLDGEMDEPLEKNIEDKLISSVDTLEKKKIDSKRIRIIDDSRKRSTINSVFDERTLFQLSKIEKNGPLEKIEGIISAGKEANVYLGYDQEGKEVAIKIYKIDSNTSRWMRNYIVGDPRFKKVPHNISKIIFLWASKEFKNLKRAYTAGLLVPKPVFIKNNILIMEYIGSGANPAPKLKDINDIEDISRLFKEISYFIKVLYQKANLVHGDLSEFNILYHNKQAIFIDVSQSVTTQHPKAEMYLARDIKNVFNFFEKLKFDIPDPEEFYYDVINN
ncbi:MAG: serine protein kinase RIO [Promethearchaeota archaeon]